MEPTRYANTAADDRLQEETQLETKRGTDTVIYGGQWTVRTGTIGDTK